MMIDTPYLPLALVAGAAFMANAGAIMQNSATMRYSLAVPQWRAFRTARAGGSLQMPGQYADPEMAVRLARRRLQLLLLGLNLLHAASGLLAAAGILGLVAAALIQASAPAAVVMSLLYAVFGAGLVLMAATALVFILESRCVSALMGLQEMQDHPFAGHMG